MCFQGGRVERIRGAVGRIEGGGGYGGEISHLLFVDEAPISNASWK